MSRLSVGEKLGPYEMLALIGAGGMGEVYRARDPRLGREVAIKVSAGKFSERFEREARAIAALNHPNICQVYDVGPNYLVMEFVEGAPIAPTDNSRKLLDLAVQIADGLAAAHAANFVHRDLKPDNILVTRDGRVKILDFGLAKNTAAPTESDATLTMAITDPGTTLGTVNYMSPEQARGVTNLTPQSDQFSFGVVLYELASGKRPFVRASAAETMTAIIREDAEPLPASVPTPLRWIIERLLAKEPAERYDSTRDLYRELRQIRERLSESTTAATRSAATAALRTAPSRSRLSLIAVGVVGLLALVMLFFPGEPPDLAAYKFTPISRQDATEDYPAWSLDGKSIAFITRVHGIDQVFVKAIDSPEATQVTHGGRDNIYPFWSRDGSTIYYTSGRVLWAVPASGGTPEKVLDDVGAPSIHPDGKTVVFTRRGKLYVESLADGEAREFGNFPANLPLGRPRFSPDGTKLSMLSNESLWILAYPSGAARKISDATGFDTVSWMPDSRQLIAVNVPNVGEPQCRLLLVDTRNGSSRAIYTSYERLRNPTVSLDGKRIAYVTAPTEWDVLEISVPSAEVRTLMAGSGVISWYADWHPSGTHFIVETNRSGAEVIEDVSAAEGFSRRVTSANGGMLLFSPDGARILFRADIEGHDQFMISSASGGHAAPLDPDPNTLIFVSPAWSPDGQWVVYARAHEGATQIVKVRAGSAANPEVFLVRAAAISGSYSALRWSPAGDWILYPRQGGLSLVSPDGKQSRDLSERPFRLYGFSKDGTQVIGIVQDTTGAGAEWQLYTVDVKTGAEKLLGPVNLPASVDALVGFSLHPDGKRFLTSAAKWPDDIWMLEDFDAPPKSLFDRLLRR